MKKPAAKAKGVAKDPLMTMKRPASSPSATSAMKRPAAAPTEAVKMKINKYLYHKNGTWGFKVNGKQKMTVPGWQLMVYPMDKNKFFHSFLKIILL